MGERKREKLTEYKCQAAKPGRHGDAAARGLYLQVRSESGKSWLYRYRDADGKERFHGLGPWPVVSLEEARQKALDCARQRLQGLDPIASARAETAKGALAGTNMTFGKALDQVIAARKPEWKDGGKSEKQWRASMRDYVLPTLGELDVGLIERAHVLKVLQPIWLDKMETAKRVRTRVEQVLDWCVALGFAKGPNPARWKGNLDALLANQTKVRKKDATKARVSHAALAYASAPTFAKELAQQAGNAAQMLRFIMLTAVRTANARFAEWSQFDLTAGLWNIPADQMKASRAHTVPLSRQAVALLEGMGGKRRGLVFKNPQGEAMSENAALALIARMGHKGKITGHGMRSTFATWAQEQTGFDRDAVRAQLAHATGDATEDAYLRGAMIEKRRVIVQAWADYLYGKPGGKVVPMRGAA